MIVVDDGSDDATARIVEAAAGRSGSLRQPAAGPARRATAAPPRRAAPRARLHRRRLRPGPRLARARACGARARRPRAGRGRPDRGGPATVRADRLVDREAGLYETANLFMRRDALRAPRRLRGLARRSLGKQLAEDVWLGWRARRAGARTGFCERRSSTTRSFGRVPRGDVGERLRLGLLPGDRRQDPRAARDSVLPAPLPARGAAEFDAAVFAAAVADGRPHAIPAAAAGRAALRVVAAAPDARLAPAAPRRSPSPNSLADATGMAALAGGQRPGANRRAISRPR